MQSTATARAYDLQPEAPPVAEPPTAQPLDQQALFSNPNPGRLIAFESLRSPSERQSIRERAAEIPRPEPLPHGKVELKRAKARRRKSEAAQQQLDFLAQENVAPPPESTIICNAPVAPPSMRIRAAVIDGAIMLVPMLLAAALFLYKGGTIMLDKHTVGFVLAALGTIPVLYKLVWAYGGRDTPGLACTGLRLVDFDGNPPTRKHRLQRAATSFISFFAAGLGLIWSLADHDTLTWHDYMSGTFPTFA